MIKDLPQLVPPKVCLACDGCCRFKDEQSPWRPKIAQEEIKQIKNGKGSLVEKVFSSDKPFKEGFLPTDSKSGVCHCAFFDLDKNACRIYGDHPFECQLYPFILTKHKEDVVICVHLNCPYVKQHRHTKIFEDYVSVLKQFFKRKEMLDFIKKNRILIGDYSAYLDELEYIFALPHGS